MQASAEVEFSGPAVQLTERAAEQVHRIREDEDLDDDIFLRVAVEGGGCSGLSYKLGFDYESEDDEVIISQGIKIIVDPKHMMYLKGISVDYPDGLDARGFTFDNPNASETCGCGSSFAT
ncbi:iron-sulfur cluster assembly accessory protein [Aliifodinibius salipaludis]|uniref:Iron-sulfur cluster assembly accessory protein n=2 Tax=Fodinibius salipaludis TaxID=2032627 RepID=A0A2A2GEV7_9BACT|nr:iron-sulfur cluster assembly accessory protein [Aliifodinibius salipaludis]